MFALLGIVGVLGIATQTQASVDRERSILETRVSAVREGIKQAERNKQLQNDNDQSGNKVAQWNNWGNWGNWANWPNWGNWPNWFNR